MILLLNIMFVTVGFVVFTSFISTYGKLKKEIEYLPKFQSINKQTISYPLIGEDINKLIPVQIKPNINSKKGFEVEYVPYLVIINKNGIILKMEVLESMKNLLSYIDNYNKNADIG